MIRNVWLAIVLIATTIPLSLVVIGCSLLGIETSLYERIPRWWARALLSAAGVRVVVYGSEHIAPGRPQIIAANHASWFDVLALAAIIPKRYRFVAKKELARVPLWGRAWRASGHISIDRSDTQRAVASLEAAGALVRSDCSAVVIYPEGTRSPDGQMKSFKKGAFMLALQTGLEIVPAGVTGAYAVMPKGRWRVDAGTIIVRFGPPIPTAEYDLAHREELMTRVRAEIQTLLDANLNVTSR